MTISEKQLKFANGCYASSPNEFQDSSRQRPDYAWLIHHEVQGPAYSIARMEECKWCDVIVEGKPFPPPDAGTNDHALNQAIISATASIYLQICLGRSEPRVLVLLFNREIVRFFVAIGEDGQQLGRWGIKYYQVGERDLNLTDLRTSVQLRALTKALRGREERICSEIRELVDAQIARGESPTVWWVDPRKNEKKRSQKIAHNDDSPGPGESGEGDEKRSDSGSKDKRSKGGGSSNKLIKPRPGVANQENVTALASSFRFRMNKLAVSFPNKYINIYNTKRPLCAGFVP